MCSSVHYCYSVPEHSLDYVGQVVVVYCIPATIKHNIVNNNNNIQSRFDLEEIGVEASLVSRNEFTCRTTYPKSV